MISSGLSTDQIVRLRRSYEVHEGGCWIWTAKLGGRGKLAIFYANGTYLSARRMVYEVERGVELPPAVKLYTTCHDPRCVNPEHMDLLTGGYTRQRERCRRGHEFTPANVYVTTQGKRACRTCIRLKLRERRARYLREGRGWGNTYRKAS